MCLHVCPHGVFLISGGARRLSRTRIAAWNAVPASEIVRSAH
ncbi:MAG: hypothetical protein KAH21_13445 [Spirochaetaceae bacterium]|nr:hypothetical protein [Spirochaetaceae bacterium]